MNEKNDDTLCLQEIYKNACDGVGAICDILPRVEDELLQKDLEQELHALRRIQMNAGRALGSMGEEPKGPSSLQRFGMKVGTSLRTMLQSGSDHIAKLMIHGNEMGVNELRSTLGSHPQVSDAVKSLASELLQIELDSQNTMKKYLQPSQ